MFPYFPNTYTPYNAVRQPTVASINGRMVTGIEEAKAAQIELDGSMWYFPSPSEGKIYTKTINMNGLPVFTVYEISKTPNVNNYEQKADYSKEILTLTNRIEQIEKIVKEMKHNEPTDANDAIVTA